MKKMWTFEKVVFISVIEAIPILLRLQFQCVLLKLAHKILEDVSFDEQAIAIKYLFTKLLDIFVSQLPHLLACETFKVSGRLGIIHTC